jgi:hypothetical protein
MPLPIVADQSIVRLDVTSFCFDITDGLNVLYGIYVAGGTPTPGGLTLTQVTTDWYSAFANEWAAFMSAQAGFSRAIGRVIDSVTPLGGHKWRGNSVFRSVDPTVVNGTVASDPLPSFNAFSIEKFTSLAGRGHNGAMRIVGVPENASSGDALSGAAQAAIQTEITTRLGVYHIGGIGNTDSITLRVMDGKLINTDPGHAPVFYARIIEQMVCNSLIGSQITRKFLRRRRHVGP